MIMTIIQPSVAEVTVSANHGRPMLLNEQQERLMAADGAKG